MVLQFAPRRIGDGSIVVTVGVGEEFTWLGGTDPEGTAEHYADRGGPALGALILSSHLV